MKPKSVTLPIEFFIQTCFLLWRLEEFYELDEYSADLCNELAALVEKKLEAMSRRKAFSDYITAPPGSPEREDFRAEYLAMTSIHKDWRSATETLDDPFYDEDIPF